MKLWLTFLLGFTTLAQAESNGSAGDAGVASEPIYEAQHEPQEAQAKAREDVFQVTEDGIYRSTRAEEHCYYVAEHDYIRCVDQVPKKSTVTIDEYTTHRTTRTHSISKRQRNHYDPLITGLGVGLAIGLPIVIYDNVDRRHSHKKYAHKRYAHKRYDRLHDKWGWRSDWRGHRSHRENYSRDRYDRHHGHGRSEHNWHRRSRY